MMAGYLITRLPIDQLPLLQGWPSDLTGVKLHVAGSNSPEREAAAADFHARGAIPVYMPNVEVPPALQRGVIDASWHPPSHAADVDRIAGQNGFYAYSVAADGSLALYIEGSVEPTPPPEIGTGTDGDDSFQSTGGVNDNEFDGGAGRDSVAYRGTRDQYVLEKAPDGSILVQKPNGGTDTLTSIEQIRYSDHFYNLEIREAAASIPAAAVDALVDLYIAYFNRVPEASGLLYWIGEFKAGQSLDQIAARFYEAGVVFFRLTGYSADMPLQEFVNIVYQNVLDRSDASAPSQSELDYWINQINSGAVSREGLVKQVLADARLFYGDPDVGYVPELLDNKVELGRLHAITYGIDYPTDEIALRATTGLVSFVEPDSIEKSVNLMGIGPGEYVA